MANQLIPPTEMEHSIPDHLTPDQLLTLWSDLTDAGEELLLAGLSREIGPDGDLRDAYRRWYAKQMEEHDRAMQKMAERLYRSGVRHGR